MQITIENGCYILQFPYDRQTVEMLKQAIPAASRKWDGANKRWIISSDQAKNILQIFPGVLLPQIQSLPRKKETRVIELRYLGTAKDRGGESVAFGFADGDWTVAISEPVLRAWFDGMDVSASPAPADTFYALLGVKQNASPDEIKQGYRRVARQWHPDICKEPNAHEMFLKIREAYDCLSSERQRARYDVGLSMTAAEAPKRLSWQDSADYRSPLRCGWLLAEGVQGMRFDVTKILGWEDIVGKDGKILVTSWKAGDKSFTEAWA